MFFHDGTAQVLMLMLLCVFSWQDWHNTQFLHIFNEHVLRGKQSSSPGSASQLEAVVDLTSLTVFEENFYLTVIEKNTKGGSLVHMWSISISSKPHQDNVDNISRTSELSGAEDDDMEYGKVRICRKKSLSINQPTEHSLSVKTRFLFFFAFWQPFSWTFLSSSLF